MNGVLPDAHVRYDYDDNRIKIDRAYIAGLESPKQTSDLESECRRIIDKGRQFYFVTFVEFPFMHMGYSKKAEPDPKERQDEVRKIMLIRLFITTTTADGAPGEIFECEGRLTEKGISVRK